MKKRKLIAKEVVAVSSRDVRAYCRWWRSWAEALRVKRRWVSKVGLRSSCPAGHHWAVSCCLLGNWFGISFRSPGRRDVSEGLPVWTDRTEHIFLKNSRRRQDKGVTLIIEHVSWLFFWFGYVTPVCTHTYTHIHVCMCVSVEANRRGLVS